MGKRFGADVAGCHTLKAVVADGGGGPETGFDIRIIYGIALLGGVSPDAGEAIGLQFQSH